MGFLLITGKQQQVGALQLNIGLNFAGCSQPESGFYPPNTMGAVGPNHIVEFINGRYVVFNKTDGSRLDNQSKSLNQFWIDAGVTPAGDFAFDPRILYDPQSGRWFASSADNVRQANNFLLAVSHSADPTEGWTAYQIDSDSADSKWADFPTLGIDSKGVYLTANMNPLLTGVRPAVNLMAIPKSSLIDGTFTPSQVIKKENLDPVIVGYTLQPVVDFSDDSTEGSAPRQILCSTSWKYTSNGVRITYLEGNLDNSQANPTLVNGPEVSFSSSATGLPPAPEAKQPENEKRGIDCLDTRISSFAIRQGGYLWGVQTVDYNNRAALRWFKINETTQDIQDGFIADPDMDFFYGSIAVNNQGIAVIGFNGSSELATLPNGNPGYVSSYAVVGETDSSGLTTFGTPYLLQAGTVSYENLRGSRNRWGDYNTMVLDSSDPEQRTFWAFTQMPLQSVWDPVNKRWNDTWYTQITQLQVGPFPVPEAHVVMLWGMGLGIWLLRRRKRPQRWSKEPR